MPATRSRMAALIFWKGMSKNVKLWVRECHTCQQCKGETMAKPGLLQPLPIPDKVWSSISMDFIEGLLTSKGKSVIFVVIYRLSKFASFIALSHPYTAITIAYKYLNQIFKLHSLLNSIVLDRDKIFIGNFWQELFKRVGTKLHLSMTYHPETDGQTEVLNRCLENYLRCMMGERSGDWHFWLPLAEWWYNSTHHSAINSTPYEALYGQPPPHHVSYLAGVSLLPMVDRTLQQREAARKMIQFQLKRAQDRMKQQANRHRSEREFEVGTLVYLKL